MRTVNNIGYSGKVAASAAVRGMYLVTTSEVHMKLRSVYRVSQKTRKPLKSLIVKIECPTKKLNVMMRKILTRCMY